MDGANTRNTDGKVGIPYAVNTKPVKEGDQLMLFRPKVEKDETVKRQLATVDTSRQAKRRK